MRYHELNGFSSLPEVLWHPEASMLIGADLTLSQLFKDPTLSRGAKSANEGFVWPTDRIPHLDKLVQPFNELRIQQSENGRSTPLFNGGLTISSPRDRKLDAPASIEIAKRTLLSGGVILAMRTVAGLFTQNVKIPDAAVFPLVGVVIGPQALGGSLSMQTQH
jgi:hypothetical protein